MLVRRVRPGDAIEVSGTTLVVDSIGQGSAVLSITCPPGVQARHRRQAKRAGARQAPPELLDEGPDEPTL